MNAFAAAATLTVIAAATLAVVANSSAEGAGSGLPPSPAPRTKWVDEFGQSLVDRILQEARKKAAGGAKGPIEVNLTFKVTPFAPKIDKPSWTLEDIKNLDVCAQVCASIRCYVECSTPSIGTPPAFLPTSGRCDEIRLEHLRELKQNRCLTTNR